MGTGSWGERVCQGRWRASSLGSPVPPVCKVVCRLVRRGGAPLGSWVPPHTLEIDGRRDVAPSPTPGCLLGWMLLSTVSLKDKMKERMEADEAARQRGGLGGGEVPANLAPPSDGLWGVECVRSSI